MNSLNAMLCREYFSFTVGCADEQLLLRLTAVNNDT